jgi:dephospho-CoA kinase
MSAKKFRQIVHLQTADAEKRARADYIIQTGTTFAATRAQVRRLVACLGRKTGR